MSSVSARRNFLDYCLFALAVLLLGVAWLAVRFLPFRMIHGWMDKSPQSRRSNVEPDRIALAVERAARRVPWRVVCIHQGIAAQCLLRWAGHRSQFVYGISHSANLLAAHVWVRLGDRILTGGEGIGDCTEMVALPQLDKPLDPLPTAG